MQNDPPGRWTRDLVPSRLPSRTARWWRSSDVGAYLNVQTGTISNYRGKGLMPDADEWNGRIALWKPATIMAWRPGRTAEDDEDRETTE